MINITKARKIMGTKCSDLSEDTVFDILGFMIMLAKIEYIIHTK